MSQRKPDFATVMRFTNFSVCWAGPNPLGEGLCFGSEDGRILFTDYDGENRYGPSVGSPSCEAVNAVAGVGDILGVSSRADVTFLTHNPPDKTLRMVAQVGTHGLVATRDGLFVGPMGPAGLFVAKPSERGRHASVIGPLPETTRLPLYQVVSLGRAEDAEVLAFAARRGGVAFTPFTGGGRDYNLRTATFDGLDVVDVCGTGSGQAMRGLAAVSRDGTLVLFRDVLTDKRPVVIKLEQIEGTAYRVFSSRGHLLVLTSSALYVLLDLAQRSAVAGAAPRLSGWGFDVPLQAVDANLCGDKYLLVVTDNDQVIRFDLSHIQSNASRTEHTDDTRSYDAPVLNPDWRESAVAQESRSLQFA